MDLKSTFGLIFWVHLIIILIWYSFPFLFSWYFALIIMIFSYLQGVLVKGCILTHLQFGKDDYQTFWGNYCEKIGLKINRKIFKIIFFWIEPAAIFIISLIWQKVLGFHPLII